MFRTANMLVSDKLQKYGMRVTDITGGATVTQRLNHYFKGKIKDAEKLVDKKGNSVLNADEVAELEECTGVEKTEFYETGLKERITDNKLKNKEKEGGVDNE